MGPKPPLVMRPMTPAVGCDDLRAVARGRAVVGLDADAAARRAVRELPRDDGGAGIAALGAAALGDRPGEIGLDRRGGLVDVVAVEAKPRLEPQRVARAEPGGLHLGLGEKAPRQARRGFARHGNLEPVLAGIARAAGDAVDAVDA